MNEIPPLPSAQLKLVVTDHDELSKGLAIADKGWKQAVIDDPALAKGVNVLDGKVVYQPVAEAHGLAYTPLESLLA